MNVQFNKIKLSILWNGKAKSLALIVVGLLVLQQFIAASSAFWITCFASAIQTGKEWHTPLGLFLLSMILPYVPGALALHLTNLWSFKVQKNGVQQYIKMLFGRVEILNNNNLKNIHIMQMSKELPQYLSELILFISQYLAQSLNLLFQLIAVSLILGSAYLLCLGLGVLLVFLYLRKTRFKNEKRAKIKQDSQVLISALLNNSWGTIIVANDYNFNLWKKSLIEAYEEGELRNKEFSRDKEFGGALISMIGALPFLIYVLFQFYMNMPSQTELITFAVLLPRIFQLFNVGTSICLLTKNISSFKGRWTDLSDKMQTLNNSASSLENRISYHDLSIKEHGGDNILTPQTFFNQVKSISKGLYSITGCNGAGKSSFLLKLKDQLKQQAFYLPANGDLNFSFTTHDNISTGQKIKRSVEEVLRLYGENNSSPIILLDEWDANLDMKTRNELFERIREKSSNSLIIEVRHSMY